MNPGRVSQEHAQRAQSSFGPTLSAGSVRCGLPQCGSGRFRVARAASLRFSAVRAASVRFRVARAASVWFRAVQGGSGCFCAVQCSAGCFSVVQAAFARGGSLIDDEQGLPQGARARWPGRASVKCVSYLFRYCKSFSSRSLSLEDCK